MFSKRTETITNNLVKPTLHDCSKNGIHHLHSHSLIMNRVLGRDGFYTVPVKGIDMDSCSICTKHNFTDCVKKVIKYTCMVDLSVLIENKVIKLWTHNRKLNIDRVELIKKHQRDNINNYGTVILSPNNITLCSIGPDIYILDGQHRMEAVKQLLKEKHSHLLKPIWVFCEIFVNCTKTFAQKQFQLINLAEPVPIDIAICNTDMNITSNFIIDRIQNMYPDMLTEKRAYRPKLSLNVLKKELTKLLITKSEYIQDKDKLFNDIITYNNKLWNKLHDNVFINLLKTLDSSTTDSIIKKTIQSDFTLGLSPKFFFKNLLEDQ